MLEIGDIIRTGRMAGKMCQEELSFGICSTSSLSRIENGEQIPYRVTYEQLMERLGLSPEIFPSFRNERELEAYRLKHEINQLCIMEKFEQVKPLLEVMKSIPQLERADRHFIEFADVLILQWSGACPNDVLQANITVAKKTVKEISPNKIQFQALSRFDLSVLNNLAISHYNAGGHEYGIELLQALIDYIERKVVDDEGISSLYTNILNNLTNWIGLKGHHVEVINLCEKGINRCIEFGTYFSFGALLFNKGYALVMLNRKEEARKYIQEAFYINRARNKDGLCDIIRSFAAEHDIMLGE